MKYKVYTVCSHYLSLCSVFCCGLGAKNGGLEMKLLNYPLVLPFCRNST